MKKYELAHEILMKVIENGRVLLDPISEEFSKDSLIVEIKYECLDRNLDQETTEYIVTYAIENTVTD